MKERPENMVLFSALIFQDECLAGISTYLKVAELQRASPSAALDKRWII